MNHEAIDEPISWPYQSIGNRHCPPVVFLHGFMGTGTDWLNIAELCAESFFCLMPDLPGHGHNIELPISQPLNFDVVVEGLNDFFEQLGLNKVGLVGYSMGGRIAFYTAIRFPHKIKSLVLESSNPGIADEKDRQARAEVDDRRAKTLLSEGIDTFVEQWYDLGLFHTLKRYPQLFAKTKEKRKKNDAQWTAKIIRELSPGRQPSLWEDLDTVSMPVMLMAGALDSKYSEIMTAMSARIPEATVEIMPDAGHNIHLEKPKHFAELITGFLQRTMG